MLAFRGCKNCDEIIAGSQIGNENNEVWTRGETLLKRLIQKTPFLYFVRYIYRRSKRGAFRSGAVRFGISCGGIALKGLLAVILICHMISMSLRGLLTASDKAAFACYGP